MLRAGEGAKLGEQNRDYKLVVNTERLKIDKESG